MASSGGETAEWQHVDKLLLREPRSARRRLSSESESGFTSDGFHSDMSEEVNSNSWRTENMSSDCFARHENSVNATQEQIDAVKETARQLAADVVVLMTEPEQQQQLSTQYSATLCRVVKELSSRHEIVFASIARRLRCGINGHADGSVCLRTFAGVVDELFADGKYNWGRVATVFAFAGWLARSGKTRTQAEHSTRSWMETVSSVAGEYIAEKLSVWICHQGGWDAMEEFFAQPEPVESKLWRGVLYTFVGLGVLATVAAAVRH